MITWRFYFWYFRDRYCSLYSPQLCWGLNGRSVKEVKREVDEIKLRVKKIELRQETDIIPPLNNIQACYTSTYDRYKDSVEDYEAMKQDISILKHALVQHCLNNSEKQCLIFVTGQGGGRRQCGGIVD